MNKKRGFTLVELLVVIAIIGILSSIVLVSVDSARAKARDIRRISDVKEIQKLLELYYDENERYPGNTDNDCGGWDVGNVGRGAGDPFIGQLVSGGITSIVPVDQDSRFNGSCSYKYYRYTGCGGFYYVLGVYLENPQTNYNALDQMDSCYPQTWWQNNRWYVVMVKE
ncbi:MAG: type II secretion system protein [bacterium]